MRTAVTTFIAFILSALVGGLVTQVIAVESGGQEEFIIAFGLTVLLAIVLTVIFFIVQLFTDQRRAASVAARILLAVYCLLAAGLWILVLVVEEDFQSVALLAALTAPGLVMIVIQWAIVRWRSAPPAPPPMRFGRDGAVGGG